MSNPIPNPAAPLSLYSVMIPWNADRSEEGTYEESVWATSPEEAGASVAMSMAEHEDSGCETDAEREEFAKNLIASGLAVIVSRVAALQSDLKELLAGPSGHFGTEQQATLEKILSLLQVTAAH